MQQRDAHILSAGFLAHEIIITYAGNVGYIRRDEGEDTGRRKRDETHKQREKKDRERQPVRNVHSYRILPKQVLHNTKAHKRESRKSFTVFGLTYSQLIINNKDFPTHFLRFFDKKISWFL
jgi:hypothetical protein